ncbi:MAG: hemerythrin family protein [Magnetococcales bacterium]|nr:hemerythrin family protein [Magnetococcales bacterium]
MTGLSVADVGVERFNRDHQRLLFYVEEFNRLAARFRQRPPFEDEWDQVDAIFVRLEKYVQMHFAAEEAMMRERGYPEIGEHMAQHAHLSKVLAELQEKVGSRQVAYIAQLQGFLMDWLRNHINRHDARYGEFFRQGGTRS